MKYKILTIVLLVSLLFAGCKVELPEQAAGNSSAASAAGSASSQEVSAVEEVSLEQSEAVTQSSSSQSVSKSASPASAAATVSSASSKKSAPSSTASPSSQAPEAKELTCSITVSCSDILTHKERFTQEQLEFIPANGIILQENNISFQAGETVFQVLLRETKRLKIPMDHAASPATQTEYVKGIGGIYEKEYGASSGWLFAVNGKQPAVGCNSYKLKDGDKIQWIFSCGQ
jgi:hypothetical protein